MSPQPSRRVIAIGLGSNMGSRAGMLALARQALEETLGPIERASRIYETEPVGGLPGQGRYLNQVVLLRSAEEPARLLRMLQAIERRLGRVRRQRWGPREIDLDLLLADRLVVHTRVLDLPHPRLSERAFVLVPLFEVLPEWVHPETGESVGDMLQRCGSEGVELWVPGPRNE